MRRILIAADAQVGGRPLILESVYYPTLVGAYARALRGAATLVVAVPAEYHATIRRRLEAERAIDGVSLVESLPVAAVGDIELDLRHVHVPQTLRASVRSGQATLDAPVWVLREAADLPRAAATLERHDMYIVARYLVIPVAKRLAHRLLPSAVTPNTVTAASCLFGVAAAIMPIAVSSWYGRVAAALFVHLSVTLDFTDGYLARLRGTDSRIGYWFDTVMDEVVKFALFIGMTALVLRDGPAWATPAAVLVLLLYHVLTCSHWISQSLENHDVTLAASAAPARWRAGPVGLLQRGYERLSYLDVHLYVVALGLLAWAEEYVLALFALVYAFRFVRMLKVRLARPSPPSAATG